MKEKPVIVLSGGHTTVPLVPHLIKEYDLAILEPQMAEAQHQKYGDSILPLLKLATPQHQEHAFSDAIRLTLQAFANKPGMAMAQHIAALPEWKGLPLNALNHTLHEWLPPYLHNSLARQMLRNNLLDALHEHRKVKLLVTHEDVTELFGGAVRWAKARAVKTLHVPHSNSYLQASHAPDVHMTTICDALAVTPHNKEFYNRADARVTGSPQFDRWASYEKDRTWARQCFRLSDKPCIVYSSSWGQWTNANDEPNRIESSYLAFLDAVKKDWQIIVAMPPGMPQNAEQWHAQQAYDRGVDCKVTRFYLELLLSAADVFIKVGASNLAVDAALLGTPLVCVNMPGYRIGHGVIEVEAGDIGAAIEQALREKPDMTELISHDAYFPDGKAAERVSKYIKELA